MRVLYDALFFTISNSGLWNINSTELVQNPSMRQQRFTGWFCGCASMYLRVSHTFQGRSLKSRDVPKKHSSIPASELLQIITLTGQRCVTVVSAAFV